MIFNWNRFALNFINELKDNLKIILLVTAGFLVITGLIDKFNLDSNQNNVVSLTRPIYIVLLLLGGGLFTSYIFRDFQDSRGKYQTLMLPVSSLERFISRYLISGPLFYLYVILIIQLYSVVMGGIFNLFYDISFVMQPFQDSHWAVSRILFFAGHAVILIGSLYFRSYALPKTILSTALIWIIFAVLGLFTIKILYYDHYPSFFDLQPNRPFNIQFIFQDWPEFIFDCIAGIIYCWLLYLAYTFLKDYEV